jgi:hypothetical protein
MQSFEETITRKKNNNNHNNSSNHSQRQPGTTVSAHEGTAVVDLCDDDKSDKDDSSHRGADPDRASRSKPTEKRPPPLSNHGTPGLFQLFQKDVDTSITDDLVAMDSSHHPCNHDAGADRLGPSNTEHAGLLNSPPALKNRAAKVFTKQQQHSSRRGDLEDTDDDDDHDCCAEHEKAEHAVKVVIDISADTTFTYHWKAAATAAKDRINVDEGKRLHLGLGVLGSVKKNVAVLLSRKVASPDRNGKVGRVVND